MATRAVFYDPVYSPTKPRYTDEFSFFRDVHVNNPRMFLESRCENLSPREYERSGVVLSSPLQQHPAGIPAKKSEE